MELLPGEKQQAEHGRAGRGAGARRDQERWRKEAERYNGEKAQIKTAADKLEAEAKAWDQRSDEQMHQHHRWAQATTVLQVSIALAAMALLTRRKWLEWGMYALAAVGGATGVAALLHL